MNIGRKLRRFLSLPVNPDETWQGGVVAMDDSRPVPDDWEGDMHLILWRSTSTELVHGTPCMGDGEDHLKDFLKVMLEFDEYQDFRFRPARIECNDRTLAEQLGERLHGSGTTVEFNARMPEWDAVLRDLLEHFSMGGSPPGSLTRAGCTEQQVRRFADAAAAFYRAGLWNHLDDVDLIKIESPRPPQYMQYAVILGSAGQTYGLGFYNCEDDHIALMTQQLDASDLQLFSLTFDPPEELAPGDWELWNEWDLPCEASDAYPSMHFFSDEGPRRPTPNELEFATLVLEALADTTEDEIDSGRWTKSVKLAGTSQEVVLAIPNLLDPPDRQEWMSRGMRPDPRENERHLRGIRAFVEEHGGTMSLEELNDEINARFTGPADDVVYPHETGQKLADVLCEQAIASFGRRRIQLAKKALAEDPTHVEANLLLAEHARGTAERIKRFGEAKDLAEQQLGPLMDEVGSFWGIPETRPFMRACHGLAVSLREAGETDEAIWQYEEMLRLNPTDNQGVRYELVPLLLLDNQDAKAAKLLEEFREETALWHYTKSLVEFRRRGRSPTAVDAMRAAFRANEHVVAILQSNQPPSFPDSYSLGSPEEAAVCIQELNEAWDETDGFFEWMLQQYFKWERDRLKKRRDKKRRKRQKANKSKRR